MTDKERRIILHSLGLDPMRRWSYRNRYVDRTGGVCEPLVEAGFMVRGQTYLPRHTDTLPPMQVFHVTDAGARAAGVFNRFKREDRVVLLEQAAR